LHGEVRFPSAYKRAHGRLSARVRTVHSGERAIPDLSSSRAKAGCMNSINRVDLPRLASYGIIGCTNTRIAGEKNSSHHRKKKENWGQTKKRRRAKPSEIQSACTRGARSGSGLIFMKRSYITPQPHILQLLRGGCIQVPWPGRYGVLAKKKFIKEVRQGKARLHRGQKVYVPAVARQRNVKIPTAHILSRKT